MLAKDNLTLKNKYEENMKNKLATYTLLVRVIKKFNQ